MPHTLERKRRLVNGIISLWQNWTLAVGMMGVLLVLSLCIPQRYVPFVAFTFEFILLYLDRRNRGSKSPICFRLPYQVSHILLYSAILMIVAIMYFDSESVTEFNGQAVNTKMPLLTILILAPISTIVSAYYMIRGNEPGYCKACVARNGNAIDRGLIGAIYNRESQFQNRLLFILSCLMTIESWIYYFLRYNNSNINGADAFFLTWLPIALIFCSIIYLGSRYHGMSMAYAKDPELNKLMEHNGTTLRFLIICDDKILLSPPDPNSKSPLSDDHKIDVPVKISLPFRENINVAEAKHLFSSTTGIDDVTVKFVYRTHDYSMYNNVFSFIAFCSKTSIENSKIKGEMFSLKQVTDMLKLGIASSSLGAMLKRIYTITMAWKTYDREGNRLYAIKHYQPTFRIRDMKNWDVDYSDNTWLLVAASNQDKYLFKLRKFWKKHIKGLGK